jgi:hypothetical protein
MVVFFFLPSCSCAIVLVLFLESFPAAWVNGILPFILHSQAALKTEIQTAPFVLRANHSCLHARDPNDLTTDTSHLPAGVRPFHRLRRFLLVQIANEQSRASYCSSANESVKSCLGSPTDNKSYKKDLPAPKSGSLQSLLGTFFRSINLIYYQSFTFILFS